MNTSWDEIEVVSLTGYDEADPGEVLPLDMQVAGRTDGSLKMSVRLVDPAGQTVAQHDVTLTPDVRLGLLVPPDSADGRYTIAAVVYDADTVEPLLDQAGNQVGNLSEVTVADSRPRQE